MLVLSILFLLSLAILSFMVRFFCTISQKEQGARILASLAVKGYMSKFRKVRGRQNIMAIDQEDKRYYVVDHNLTLTLLPKNGGEKVELPLLKGKVRPMNQKDLVESMSGSGYELGFDCMIASSVMDLNFVGPDGYYTLIVPYSVGGKYLLRKAVGTSQEEINLFKEIPSLKYRKVS